MLQTPSVVSAGLVLALTEERRKSGVFDAGMAYDTSPQNGCCTATWRLLSVNLLKRERLREKSLRAGCCPATAG